MNDSAGLSSPARMDAAIVEFVQALERGEAPNRAALLSEYADVGAELAEFFADHDRLSVLATPNRPTTAGLEQTELLTPGRPGSTDVTWRPAPSEDGPS